MKKYLLAVLAFALLFGCFGGGDGELNVIPDKASGYVVFRLADFLSDQDFLGSMDQEARQSFDDSINKMKSETGIDPYKITKMTFFFDLGVQGGDTYGAFILFGDFEQQKITDALKQKGELREEQYEGVTLYVGKSDLAGQATKSKVESAIAFLNSKTAVFGTLEAVKDSIDVKNGKRAALQNGNLDRVVGSVGGNSMLYAATEIPESLTKTSTASATGVDAGKLRYAGFAFNKAGSEVSINAALIFASAADAEKAKDSLQGMVSLLRGFAKSGSATETLLKGVTVDTADDIVEAKLTTTKETLKELGEELKEQYQQAPPSSYSNQGYRDYPDYNTPDYGSPTDSNEDYEYYE